MSKPRILATRRTSAYLEPVSLHVLAQEVSRPRVYTTHPSERFELFGELPPDAVFTHDPQTPSPLSPPLANATLPTSAAAPLARPLPSTLAATTPPAHTLSSPHDSKQRADWLARHEHGHGYPHLSLSITDRELDANVGRAVGWYMRCLRATEFGMYLLGVPGFIQWILQLSWTRATHDIHVSSTTGVYDLSPLFYVGRYPHALLWIWRTSILLVCVTVPVLLYRYKRSIETRTRERQLDDLFTGQMGCNLDVHNLDAFTANHQLSTRRRCFGKLEAAVWFLVILGVETVINYAVIFHMTHTSDTQVAVLLSIVLAVFNAVWQLVCEPITDREFPLSASSKYSSYFVKAYAFQMICGSILVCFMHFAWIEQWQITEPNTCPLVLLAHKYLITVMVSIGVSSFVQVVLPLMQIYLVRKCCRNRSHGNQTHMPEFLLGDEYTLLLYVMYVTVQGHTVFPLLPWVTGILLRLKSYVDIYRILRICKPMIITKNTFLHALLVCVTITLLLSIVLPPTGILWIWRGDYYHHHPQCNIYG